MKDSNTIVESNEVKPNEPLSKEEMEARIEADKRITDIK